MGRRIAICLVAACAATAVVAGPSAAAPSQKPPSVSCQFDPESAELGVRLRQQIVGRSRNTVDVAPPSVGIERRIDEITVIDLTQPFELDLFEEPRNGSLRSCGRPTVSTTESIDVRLGKRSESGDLYLDLGYGPLAPGLTDEGDGSSEVEIDARLGLGTAYATLTREPDVAQISRRDSPGLPTEVNLDAQETTADTDLGLGARSEFIIDGAGGDDRISSDGAAGDLDAFAGAILFGGQGADALIGGAGSELLWGGPGVDEIDAGAGQDAVLAIERVRDRIDCGAGRDFVITDGQRFRLPPSCERLVDLTEPQPVVVEQSSRRMSARIRELQRFAR